MTIIIIILAILLFGIVHIIFDARSIDKKRTAINSFLQILNEFIIKYKANDDNSNEVNYIMAYGDEVSNYMGESLYNSPIITIQNQIRNNNIFTIEDEVRKVFCNAPKAITYLQKSKTRILLQLWNPFIWFYRGVEVLSYIVLGYFVNTGSIEYRGKVWNTFNAFFTLITGVATLIGFILQIKGLH